MLTQTLRNLEAAGLVSREVTAAVPVRVDYELTGLGRSLHGVLQQLKAWAEEHMVHVEAHRAAHTRWRPTPADGTWPGRAGAPRPAGSPVATGGSW